MDYCIGHITESKEDFLKKEGIFAPYNLKLAWSSVPAGFLPVVLIQNVISPFAIIAHDADKLEELTSMYDDRERTIYFVKTEKLLAVAGKEFIEYARENNLASEEAIAAAIKQEEENLAKLKSLLFEGTPAPMGGLSNEDALVRACPEEFKRDNPWSDLASKVFFLGVDASKWKFKSTDKDEKRKQMLCFRGLLETFGIAHQDKEAVAGWMLSEMLAEVPEHVAVKA